MEKCQNPNTTNRRGCLAMPKDEIDLKLQQILEKLTIVSEDSKEIKKILQDHAIKVVTIEKDIERIDKEIQKNSRTHERDVEIIHNSIHRRDKKQMWLTGIFITIGGIIVTIINIFIAKN